MLRFVPNQPSLKVSGCLLMLAFTLASSAFAQPTTSSIDVRALQIGIANRLTLTGGNLGEDSKIVAPFEIESQKVIEAAGGKKLIVEIVPAVTTSPGLYPVRVVNAQGISPLTIVSVDRFRNEPFAETVSEMPIALHGQLRGGQILKTVVQGKTGQTLIAEIDGKRLGSDIRGVLRLYDPRGTQIAWSRPEKLLDGDSRLQVKLPHDGEYSIALHDILYRAPGNSSFRLKIGDFNHADLAFPIAVQANAQQTARFPSSHLPGDPAVNFQAPSRSGWHALALSDPQLILSTSPKVLVTDHVQFIEDEKETKVPIEIVPAGINGILAAHGETDRYEINVKAGQLLRFEVFADRIGSPVDARIVVKDLQGNQLAENDDQEKTSDPAAQYNVPKGTERIAVEVSDVTGAGGDDHIYLLQLNDENVPDFKLTTPADTINLPANGSIVLRIEAERKKYDGPIALQVDGLPEGVAISGNTISAGNKFALLSLTAGATALKDHAISIVGIGNVDGGPRQFVRWAETPASLRLPWLSSEFAVANAAATQVQLQLDGKLPDHLYAGSEIRGRMKLTRSETAKEKVRVRMETSQTIPQKKVRENDKDVVVDDTEKMLRLSNPVEFPDGGDTVDFQIAVPNDLPERDWAISLVAERLSADGKNVIEKSSLPTVMVPVKRAFTIEATGERRVEIDPKNNKHGKIGGAITRNEGFTGAVTISLTGLPENVTSPSVVVTPEQTVFELPIQLTGEVKAEQLGNVSMIGESFDAIDKTLKIASSSKVKLSIALPEAK